MDMQVMTPGQTRTRATRRPSFPILGKVKPYGLYPVMVHPVLPGETLQSATVKWRTMSKPINHPLIGSWQETWLVYIKLTDISRDLGEMFISDDMSSTSYDAASDSDLYFTKTGQIDWVHECTKRFHEAYFLDDDETAKSFTTAGAYQLKLQNNSWMQNLMFRPADDAVDTTDVMDMHKQLEAWQMLKQMQMTEMTYEKYLEQYGVYKKADDRGGVPEILRYSRSWTLPKNTVEPSDGSPSTAWWWSDEIEANKAKRFDEPGFVVMFTTIRPKMYNEAQRYSMVGNLWGFTDWYPAYNLQDPNHSVKEILNTDAVFEAGYDGLNVDDALLYDHNDLLMHGEQFINDRSANVMGYRTPYATAASADTGAAVQDVRGEYCSESDVNGLFVSATETDQYCMYEGIVQLRLSGHVRDFISK